MGCKELRRIEQIKQPHITTVNQNAAESSPIAGELTGARRPELWRLKPKYKNDKKNETYCGIYYCRIYYCKYYSNSISSNCYDNVKKYFLQHHKILMVLVLARQHLTCTKRAMSCWLSVQLVIRCFFLSCSRYQNGQVKLLTWSFLFCPSLHLCLATNQSLKI